LVDRSSGEALDAIREGIDGARSPRPKRSSSYPRRRFSCGIPVHAGANAIQPAAGGQTAQRLPLDLQPSLRRESFYDLGFVERRENVIFLGPPGVGKTHLPISLAIAAAQIGRCIYYARSAP
jgi:IstB-like ATP binding protein